LNKKKAKKIKSSPVAQLVTSSEKSEDDLRQPSPKRITPSTAGGGTATPESEAPKYDDGKLMFDLLMPGPLRQVVAVLTFGAEKYGPNTYRRGLKWSRYVGAALRHIWAWYGGEMNDPESGLHHLAHAICCLLFLLDFEDIRPEFDDRPEDFPFRYAGTDGYDKKHGWTP
jgi:hypothetical protein